MRLRDSLVVTAVWMVVLVACGGATDGTSDTAPAGTSAPAASSATTTAPNQAEATEASLVATGVTSIIDNLDGIQGHFNSAVVGISQSTPGNRMTESAASPGVYGFVEVVFGPPEVMLEAVRQGGYRIPSGFTARLGRSGRIGAPAGACGAGASAEASFNAKGDGNEPGPVVTSDLLDELDVSNIDFDVLTGGDGQKDLEQIITSLIVPGDPRLASPSGWDEAVWEPLAEMQEPAESLMDYHLWTVASDIETLVVNDVRDTMVTRGIPQMVIDAFDASNRSGWFANKVAAESDRLASMDIEAVFSGDIAGVINEERDFSIPVPGEMPVFSQLVGGGSVVFEHPTLGPLEFDVDLEWTGWDELGRVNVGTAHFTNEETGYEIRIEFAEDGTKAGDVLLGGEVVGTVDLSTEGGATFLDLSA